MSWEDPDADALVLEIDEKDVCLTLTSGGCNSLNLVLHDAKEVYSVDCNPAQSALLELKISAIKNLEFEQVWKMFGEGKLENIEIVYRKHLMPFMTQNSIDFWNKKLYHFKRGLYYAGGMGKVCWMVQYIIYLSGMAEKTEALVEANTLEVSQLPLSTALASVVTSCVFISRNNDTYGIRYGLSAFFNLDPNSSSRLSSALSIPWFLIALFCGLVLAFRRSSTS